MSEETTAPVEQSLDTSAVDAELEALRRKNRELLEETKKAKAKAQSIPDGIDVQELIEFRNRHEQAKLESEGKYAEARQALEAQFREQTAAKDQRINDLETKVRELELVSPAMAALAEVVHDPEAVLRLKLKPEQMEREPDGTVVVVDGYQRTPVKEWASSLPAWMQKAPKPQGSGAPAGNRATNTAAPAGLKNPFTREHFNLTEQARIYKTDPDLYQRLKAAAK
jgi:hypothetical protein